MLQLYKRYAIQILKKYPKTRNSYETFLIKYIEIYYMGSYEICLRNISIVSLLRAYRQIQNTDKKYPPTIDVQKARKRKQKRLEYGGLYA